MLKCAFITLLCAVLSISFTSAAASCAGTAKPRIAVDYAPAAGGGYAVEGHVWFEGGSGNYSGYAVTMALEVTRGGKIWGPKPTYEQPSVPLDGEGNFSCRFVTGGNDDAAERLYVCLIPSDFKPDDDFARTDAAALDKVIIDRYADGKLEIKQVKPPPPPSVIFPQQKHPKDTNKISICYSPYTNGLSPETNGAVPMEQMRWQLNLIYPYADTIRLFGVSGELEKIYKPAKEEYKMRIIAGCWIESRYSEAQIYAELDKLIELTNKGYVDIAVVGSETMRRNDFTADALISYIRYVRERIAKTGVPVGTSDIPAAFLDNPKLVENCDVVLCTIYPFFGNVTANAAAANLSEVYGRVADAAGGRQVIISESGWPTQGSAEGASVPGIENAGKFFKETYEWSRKTDTEIVFFSEIDEAWKVEGTRGDIGASWGHFTSAGMLKEAYLPVYQTISAAPVLDAAAVKWAEEAIQELVSKGVANPNGPSLYAPLTPITRGDFIHYLVKALSLEKKTGRVNAAFTDVDPNIYYYFTVGSGQAAGLVAGVGNNRCNPLADVTREDMFTLIYRALKYAGMELLPGSSALARFRDRAAVDGYAEDAISALAENGLILGDQNGNVNPLANATRAEAAALLYRVYKFVNFVNSVN